MTEQEWQTATDPTPMLEFLEASGKASDRKFRLFGVACCRNERKLMSDGGQRRVILLAEAFADDEVTWASLDAARLGEINRSLVEFLTHPDGHTCASLLVENWQEYSPTKSMVRMPDYLRDLIGNPFRPVTIDPDWGKWRDETPVKIAPPARFPLLLLCGFLEIPGKTRLAAIGQQGRPEIAPCTPCY